MSGYFGVSVMCRENRMREYLKGAQLASEKKMVTELKDTDVFVGRNTGSSHKTGSRGGVHLQPSTLLGTMKIK